MSGPSAARLAVYWREHRRFAVLARRFKFMLRDEKHEILADRARAAHGLAMFEVEELARRARGSSAKRA